MSLTTTVESSAVLIPDFVVVNKSDFTQTVFLGSGPDIAAPSVFTHGLLTVVADTSLDIAHVLVGQTEPPLVRIIDADTVSALQMTGAAYTYRLKVKNKLTGVVAVNTSSVVFALQADGSATLTHYFSDSDLTVEGDYYLQFSAVRNSDQRILRWQHEILTVRNG